MNVETTKDFDTLPPCGIRVDVEGNWYYEDRPIIRSDILELFHRNLYYHPGLGFWIEWQGNKCLLDADDTPFIITEVDKTISPDGDEEIFLLRLKYLPNHEVIDPKTLFVGKDNVLYCKIKNGEIPARFSRPAYYQFARWVQEDNGKFFISLNGISYYIKTGD